MLRPFTSSAPAAAAQSFDIEAESQRMEMKFQMESMCAALHFFVLKPVLSYEVNMAVLRFAQVQIDEWNC